MDPNSYEISYSPSADYHGSDTLTYDLGDEDGLTHPGAIALIVWPVNDLPLFSGGPLQRDVARRAQAGDDVGNSVTAWVADSGQDQLFAWVSQSGERHEAREFELAERNRDPRGVWADGEVIYVLDSVKDALFVYDLETADLLAEHALGKLSRSPRGLWSDGVTLWVSDDGAKRLFAYEFDDGALSRNEELEFTFRSLLKAGNGDPRGIWSDGDVIYVADEQDDKVYSYNLPDATIAQLASLSLSELELELGEFSPLRSDYASVAPVGVATTTITAIATQNEAGIEIQPDDPDADTGNGHQVAIVDAGQFSITVTSADASRSSVYRVQIQRCLSGLTQDRLSTVHYAGGSVDQLVGCARSLGSEALYHQREGVWVGWFLAGPELINRYFRRRFSEGLPAGLQLVPKLDEVQSSRPGSANDN